MLTDVHLLNMTSSPVICEFPTLQHPVNHPSCHANRSLLSTPLWSNLNSTGKKKTVTECEDSPRRTQTPPGSFAELWALKCLVVPRSEVPARLPQLS